MKNCLHCDKELTHVEGRKQKSFCNVNCRNKYFYKKNKDLIQVGRNVELGKITKLVTADIVTLGIGITEVKGKELARIDPLSDKGQILQQVAAIKAEKCPKERDTPMGRKIFEADKKKRITELEQSLKPPIGG